MAKPYSRPLQPAADTGRGQSTASGAAAERPSRPRRIAESRTSGGVVRHGLSGLVIGLLLAVAPVAGEAQVGKMPRVGLVLPGSPSPEYDRRLEAFRQGLREFGFTDKQNIVLEYRWAHGKFDPIPDLVADLLSLPVDVLVTDGQRSAHAAKDATSTVPIVLAVVGDVLQTGLVASLARPGGNLTGMTIMTPELGAKRLALLKHWCRKPLALPY